DRFLPLLLGPLEPAHALQNASRQKTVGNVVPRIRLAPSFTGLPRPFQIPRRRPMIDQLNKKPLMLARTVPQFPSSSDILLSQSHIAHRGVRTAEHRESRRELGIDRHGALQ